MITQVTHFKLKVGDRTACEHPMTPYTEMTFREKEVTCKWCIAALQAMKAGANDSGAET